MVDINRFSMGATAGRRKVAWPGVFRQAMLFQSISGHGRVRDPVISPDFNSDFACLDPGRVSPWKGTFSLEIAAF
jgi:hypothetical protein